MTSSSRSDYLQVFSLDASGSWVQGLVESSTCTWLHLDADGPRTRVVLRQELGLLPHAAETLLALETRPRVDESGSGAVVILRGVNLNPGADPEDMVALRAWVEPGRLITVSRRRLMAVGDLAESLEGSDPPKTSRAMLLFLADRLLARMGPTFDALSDGVDAQEDHALADLGKAEQVELADLRRQVIALRRHLAPQREAMARLGETLARLFPGEHGSEVRGLVESVTRLVEELDELRDRTAVTQDLLAGQQADVMNRQMLMLSIVAAIFLPLGLLTGLLGINVGGMPGVESPWAFGVVCVVLLVVAGIQVAVMRRMRFF